MTPDQIHSLAWSKGDGLLPAVVQHARTGRVLMVGLHEPRKRLRATLSSGRVGVLQPLAAAALGEGRDLRPLPRRRRRQHGLRFRHAAGAGASAGPTCHKGTETCFGDGRADRRRQLSFLALLESTIASRITDKPEDSYTARLLAEGPGRIAQKVGEEGVEIALAAVTRDDAGLLSECADLLYHVMVMLQSRKLALGDVVRELESRHGARR